MKKDKITPKKVVYIILTAFMGGLLGCIAYGLLSLILPLRPITYPLLVVFGGISGIPLGFRWWHIVYIEKRTWKKWVSKI